MASIREIRNPADWPRSSEPQESGASHVCGLHPPHRRRTSSADNAGEAMLAVARDLGVLDLVLMGDSALRLGHGTIDELAEAAARRRRGAPMLRRIIRMLDQRSESPWESVMRVLHRAADIPVEPQHEVFDHWGRFVARGDLWIVGTNRLHEFDGGGHREADIQRSDLTRDRRLIEANWQRFGFTKAQLLNEGRLHHRVHRQAAGSQLGSRAAPPMERTDSKFDVWPPGPRPSSPPVAFSPITVDGLHPRGWLISMQPVDTSGRESHHHLPSSGWDGARQLGGAG
jgi:hypothetical protein